jgi:hypothetical protein
LEKKTLCIFQNVFEEFHYTYLSIFIILLKMRKNVEILMEMRPTCKRNIALEINCTIPALHVIYSGINNSKSWILAFTVFCDENLNFHYANVMLMYSYVQEL